MQDKYVSFSKLSNKQKQEIVRIYQKETTPIPIIRKKYNISITTFYRALEPYRIKNVSLRRSSSPDKKRLNSEQIDKLVKVYREAKYTTKELCKLFNIRDGTLYRVLRSQGIPLHKELFKEDLDKKHQQAVALYEEGKHRVKDIFKLVGTTSTAFHRYVKVNNIKLPKLKQPEKINREYLNEAFRLYEEGNHSINEICKLTNIPLTTFYKYFAEAEKEGLVSRKNKKPRVLIKEPTLEQSSLAIELYRKGDYKVPEICDFIGISRHTLYKILEPEREKGLIARSEIYKQDTDKVKRAIELYKEKELTLEEIEKETGISIYRIKENLKKLRLSGEVISRRGYVNKLSKDVIEEAIKLYSESDLVVNDICKRAGISETSLYFYLLLHNVPLRIKRRSIRREKLMSKMEKVIEAYKNEELKIKDIAKVLKIKHQADFYLSLHAKGEILRTKKIKEQYKEKFEYALSLCNNSTLSIRDACKKAKITEQRFLLCLEQSSNKLN